MPLELGIAMGRSLTARSTDEAHDWLLLVPRGHLYARFASDLAGYDAKHHDVTPESAVPAVMSWLLTRPNATSGLTPKRVLCELPRFVAARQQLEAEWSDETPWSELVLAARAAVPL